MSRQDLSNPMLAWLDHNRIEARLRHARIVYLAARVFVGFSGAAVSTISVPPIRPASPTLAVFRVARSCYSVVNVLYPIYHGIAVLSVTKRYQYGYSLFTFLCTIRASSHHRASSGAPSRSFKFRDQHKCSNQRLDRLWILRNIMVVRKPFLSHWAVTFNIAWHKV
jgi:hypothetical protein